MISPEESKSAVRVLSKRGLLGLSLQQKFAHSVTWAKEKGLISENPSPPQAVVETVKPAPVKPITPVIDYANPKAQCPQCNKLAPIFKSKTRNDAWVFGMHRSGVNARGYDAGAICGMAGEPVIL